MKFLPLLKRLIFLQNLCFFILCDEIVENPQSLILTSSLDRFHYLTQPTRYDKTINTRYFAVPRLGNTYRFCPTRNDADGRLLYKADKFEFKTTKEIPDAECQSPIKATMIKVLNPGKLTGISWNNKEMELFHSGFMVYFGLMRTWYKTLFTTRPDYGPNHFKHELVILIQFYYNKKIQQTVATQYTILSTRYKYIKNVLIHEKLRFPTVEGPFEKTPPLFSDVDSLNYVTHFEGTLEEKWIEKLRQDSKENPLSTLEFASYEHFALELWNLPARFTINYIPLWKKPKFMWLRVEIFAKLVSRTIAELQVTAGVTGTMTLSGRNVEDKNGYKMPKYFWKVFQFHWKEHAYGIIVVLNCNPFEKTEQKLCAETVNCENNGWIISNTDYLRGEIYCCGVTKNNIKMLQTNFLTIKEDSIFNLNHWPERNKIIQDEYNLLIKDPKYNI